MWHQVTFNSTLFAVLCILSWKGYAAPIKIVDTGQGTTPYWTLGLGPSSGSSNDDQWLAAQFTTIQPWDVTGIEGWIVPRTTGDVNLTIYSDGGDIPGMELFTQQITVTSTCPQPCTNPPPLSAAAWWGTTSLNLQLQSGTYWVAFETRAGSTFRGYMPGSAPSPLLNESTTATAPPAVWYSTDGLDLGVRISAIGPGDSDVPEPATLGIVGLCCLGFVLMFRGTTSR